MLTKKEEKKLVETISKMPHNCSSFKSFKILKPKVKTYAVLNNRKCN